MLKKKINRKAQIKNSREPEPKISIIVVSLFRTASQNHDKLERIKKVSCLFFA